MFPITVTIHNPQQLAAVLAAMGEPLAAKPETPSPRPPATNDAALAPKEPKPGKSTAAATAAASPAPGQPTAAAAAATDAPEKTADAPAPTAAPAEAESSASTAAAPSVEAVARAITSAVKVNRQKVIDLLAKFNATKGSELKEDQRAAFLAELEA